MGCKGQRPLRIRSPPRMSVLSLFMAKRPGLERAPITTYRINILDIRKKISLLETTYV